jgi:hypothetical protein
VRAAHDGVAHAEGAALHDDGGERAAAEINLRLDDHAAGLGLRVGLQLQHVGLEEDHLEQFVDALPLMAATGTVIVSPPQSSGAMLRCCICCFTGRDSHPSRPSC